MPVPDRRVEWISHGDASLWNKLWKQIGVRDADNHLNLRAMPRWKTESIPHLFGESNGSVHSRAVTPVPLPPLELVPTVVVTWFERRRNSGLFFSSDFALPFRCYSSPEQSRAAQTSHNYCGICNFACSVRCVLLYIQLLVSVRILGKSIRRVSVVK